MNLCNKIRNLNLTILELIRFHFYDLYKKWQKLGI